MAMSPATSLLGRRLDRLRQAGPLGDVAPPARARLRLERAAALAAGVGGSVLPTADGPVVCVTSAVPLALEAAALAELPWEIDPRRPLAVVDVETTGLSTAAGTVPFLVGIGCWRRGTLDVTQLLLPDHPNEPALLSALTAHIPAGAWLVSYNGRSFDWPLLVSRYRLHRRDPPSPAGHLDLLSVSRQLWKHRLGSARLTVVEALAGVRRVDDLPGALVPERYFSYLRDGNPGALPAVLRHNRQDIVSLALLLGVLASEFARRDRWHEAHPGDLGGLARAYARRGRLDDALVCLETALCAGAARRSADGGVIRRRLLVERARLLARAGRYEEAAVAWLELATSGGPGAASAWLWLARHREHRLRDRIAALHACQQAMAIAERARLWGRPMAAVERDLRRRMPRLRRLMAAGGASSIRARRRAA
jgi:uncharacterized protein YprB with RNaseH-like and TPR domain